MDVVRAYEILREHNAGEGRLLWERVAALLVSNSLLLVAFFMSVPHSEFKVLHLALPIIAIVLCVGFAYLLWVGARAMLRWNESLRRIEQEPGLGYIYQKRMRPLTDIVDRVTLPTKLPQQVKNLMRFYSLVFPAVFIAVWAFCLVGVLN